MTEISPEREDGAPISHLDDGTLSAHLDRELDAGDTRAVMAHLESCPSCRQRLESLSQASVLAGRPVSPMPPAFRQLQLERAIDRAPVLELAESRHRHRSRPQVARWAAALVIVAGGGIAFWRLHSNHSGGVSSSAGPEMGTQHSASLGAGAVRPVLQVRIVEGVPHRGCASRSTLARTAPPGAATVYDTSASVVSGRSECARVGKLLFTIDPLTRPQVQDNSGGPLATMVLTVPAASAQELHQQAISTSHMPRDADWELGLVAGDELVGYLSSVQASGHVTVGRVPAGLALELAGDL